MTAVDVAMARPGGFEAAAQMMDAWDRPDLLVGYQLAQAWPGETNLRRKPVRIPRPDSVAEIRREAWTTRSEITHTKCWGQMRLSRYYAEEMALRPGYFKQIHCAACGATGPLSEFTWDSDGSVVT